MTFFDALRRRAVDLIAPPALNAISYAREGLERERRQQETIRGLSGLLLSIRAEESVQRADNEADQEEFFAAQRMAGSGPWQQPGTLESQKLALVARESATGGISAQGAYGDIELALQNISWRRQTNLAWMEFSRWGIQQIILISRLYYLKNPIIQRGINVSALYVFGRGVQVSSPDEAANQVLQDFFTRNKSTLGQNALMDLERRKYYDGNLFFCFFTSMKTGEVDVRTIDATEITDIITDPGDSENRRYFLRVWTETNFDEVTGSRAIVSKRAYYPALGYEPDSMPVSIGGIEVMRDMPVLQRKVGGVAKWLWGCPLVYAALDWAKASREWLEACMTVRQALAQFAMLIQTKGGQDALQGVKQQLSTTVGPSSSLLDQNPTAVNGSTFASGMGTKLEAFKTQGAGGNPDDVRRYLLMCAMTFGIPESFFGDMNTSNLATAQSLDRPTELNFGAKQEEWSEDFVTISRYVLMKSGKATGGRLRESLVAAKCLDKFTVRECRWTRNDRGRKVYEAADRVAETGVIRVVAEFPAIIEADTPGTVSALVEAMTLGSRRGDINGTDQRATLREIYRVLGFQDFEDLLKAQFPDSGPNKYDPVRTSPEDPEAQNPDPSVPKDPKAAGVVKEALKRLEEAMRKFRDLPDETV